MARREAEFVMHDEQHGFWHLVPKECPAKGHLEAVGLKPWMCVYGLVTNAQGAVPIGDCKHKSGDVETEGERIFVNCTFEGGRRGE